MRYCFGECVFHRDRRELVRDGSIVHAGPKLLKLLELLIDARPKALTKDEIHRSLWPGTFVSDATLTSLVAELRAAIGDAARVPRLIRTIHGYGYAFCGDVAVGALTPGPTEKGPQTYRLVFGGREIALGRGEHLLGRANDAAVFVDDTGVSRYHARITIGERGVTLEDLGSKNGTMLDGCAITAPMPVADGAVIVLGATVLKFRILEPSGSTETLDRQSGPARGKRE
jgi:DNA-binding winged helix-turn-helix (wHTH) protein